MSLSNWLLQTMKFIKTLILPFFSLTVLLNACHADQPKAIHDNKGQVVDLDKHPHKYLIINYWASWCEACKYEIPELNQFYKHHKDQVELYGYEFDKLSQKDLNTLVKQHGIDYPQLLDDPTEKLKLDPVEALPVTFVFDENNHLVKTLMGPQQEKDLNEVISKPNK